MLSLRERFNWGKKLASDKLGQGIAGKIVGIAIGLFVCASIIPSALVMMKLDFLLSSYTVIIQSKDMLIKIGQYLYFQVG